MKRKHFLVVLLLLLTVFMLSCITSRDTHVEISCDDFAKNPTSIRNDLQIEVGDKIYVKLCSNPSTGFKWSYKMSGDNVVKEEGYDFEDPDSNVVGSAGKEVWTFEGASTGNAEISMSYSQPWEGGTKNEWTYKITVEVK